jgi:tetratricopeptide (TPR) repeat protein
LKAFLKIATILVVLNLFLSSCSRKKNSFISRNFHAVTAEYNALFNGHNALIDGVTSLNESYQDNYWEILPIERMQINEDVFLPGQSKNPNFERAEEKAVKAIQRHSMNIEGKENNPQMDEAYLLLGKARYFDQRFIPALEAFNYILYKYPASDKINQAKIWREKTNIRLENDELAVENLKRLLEQEELKDQDLADATSMLAQAYLNLKYTDSALAQIKTASEFTKNNEEKGRYNFIKGQLYNKLEYKDSANSAFDQVIELHRKTPRIYYISAHLEKVKNFDLEHGNKLEFIEYLTELEENRENRPYLDKIYFQIGEYHNKNESDSISVSYYNKSLRTNSVDKYLKAINYQRLGDLNFDTSQYLSAGAYFDSTMLNLKKNSKLYRSIKRKRDNLEEVIFYEDVAKRNDSIIYLVNLPEQDRLMMFEALVEDLKEKDEARKEREALKQSSGLIVDPNNTSGIGNQTGNNNSQNFYFYNPTTVAFGKNEFIKIWGEREYKDNWRWSKSGIISDKDDQSTELVLERLTEDEKYDPNFYISRIPSDKKEIDSIIKDRNFAYYQLGLIYKDKFKEFELSKNKLKELLKSNPEERLILPAKYNLYKVYLELNKTGEADIVKADILENYPDSRYASILNNPDLQLEKDQNSPEVLYESLYAIHETQKYEEVISKCDEYVKLFEGEKMVSKFEFLKATAIGRLNGYDPYKEALNYIALNYPNSPEGKQAERLIQEALPKLASKDFTDDDASNRFKVIYQFEESSEDEITEFVKILNEVIKDVDVYDLTSSIDVYTKNTTFVVVHGLRSINGAKGFVEILGENKNKITKDHFAISAKNYEIIQIHKNLESYLESQ